MTERFPKLTAKVYWDAGSLGMDLSQGLRGLDILSDLTGSIEMIEESRLIRLENIAEPYIDWQHLYRRFKLDADLNFVLTRRPIMTEDEIENKFSKDKDHVTAGLALQFGRVGSRRCAFIDVQRTWYSDDVVLHEAAHLLSVRQDSLEGDPQHCGLEDCIMYPVDKDIEQSKFCIDCEEQLVDNADKLRYAKYGRFALAPNAIFNPSTM